ncbi:MAG: class A beta-lactamase-related serine hydrolase, partial [Mycobacterium sp.]|nr:class A beta-lactamase-related serine hydrolase [Mycobacterium sp.]
MRRRRTPMFLTGVIATVVVLLVGASSAQLSGGPGGLPQRTVTLLSSGPETAPQAPPAPAPREPVNLDVLAQQATAKAQRNGADISIAVLDRQSGQLVTKGDGSAFPIASVAKLFIADDLLLRVAEGKATLSAQDRRSLDTMLRASDDFAANEFWERGGRNAVIARIVDRYGLRNTSAP